MLLVASILLCELLIQLESFPQVFILLLELKQLRIHAIDSFTLLLNGFSQGEIALEDLFHHIHSVDDALRDGVLRFVGC